MQVRFLENVFKINLWYFFKKVKFLLLQPDVTHNHFAKKGVLTVQIKNISVLVNEFYNLYAYSTNKIMTFNTLLLICH